MPILPPQNPLEDPALEPYRGFSAAPRRRFTDELLRITTQYGSLRAYANLHTSLGLHRVQQCQGRNPLALARIYAPGRSRLADHGQTEFSAPCQPIVSSASRTASLS